MREAMFVFVAGLSGVFVGMAVLYLAIRVVSLVTGRLAGKDHSDA